MVRLRRSIRFIVNPAPADAGQDADTPRNGFAGRPPMRGLGRFYEIEVVASGEPDPTTGYILNIRDIDQAALASAIPIIERACAESPTTEPASLLPPILDAIARALPSGRLDSVRWRLTPYYSLEMTPADTTHVTLRQQFDFAAAHRLHVPALSDEQNRAIFGHCNNPAGHGHNYRIEPAVSVQLDTSGPAFSLAQLERVTDEAILNRFDHTHLNQDTPEFAAESGVTPSVENIARVFYELLAPAIDKASAGRASLQTLTVWETDRTSCTYPG